MQAYTLLSVVNSLLGLLGELPVADLDEEHTLVPSAIQHIKDATLELQSTPWWFNQERTTLYPDSQTKKVYVGSDVQAVDTLTTYPRVAPRGDFLYNLDRGTYEFDQPLTVTLNRILPFELCPAKARIHIAALAAHTFVVEQEGDQLKIQECLRRVQSTYIGLNAESIRNDRANLFLRSGVQRIINDIGRF